MSVDTHRLITDRKTPYKRWVGVSHVALSILLLHLVVHAQSATKLQSTSQRVFGLEGGFEHPAHLPEDVLTALTATKEAAYVRDELKENPHLEVSQFFQAEEVHLSDPAESDYVVVGQFPLTGADCELFWIVRSIKPRPRVIHFSVGTTLKIVCRKNNEELPNIRMDWWAGSGHGWADEYRFNGSRYVSFRKLDTFREFKKATATSPSSWVLRESHPSRGAGTQ